MIKQFHLENFRSYHNADLPLAPLTLLIGANASGKSNVIEALRLLSTMARGQYLSDVFKTLEREGEIRGTTDTLTYDDSNTFTLGCTLTDETPYRDFIITIQNTGKDLIVVDEKMALPPGVSYFPLYQVERIPENYSHQLRVAYNNFAQGGTKPQIGCDNRQAIFTQLTTPARFSTPKAQESIPAYTQDFRNLLENMLFLDPIPQQMRAYSFIQDVSLRGSGKNISSVLYELCQEPAQKEQLLTFVRSLPEQDIEDIGFVQTPRQEVMVSLHESFGGMTQERDATLLSDGTLRVLAVAAALLSAPEGSQVIIEEIDNGIHPSRADTLMQNIQKIVTERHIRVLLTTHNPALMDALPLESIPDVVYCYRDPQDGDSRLVQLAALPDYVALIAQGTVGHLVTRRIVEEYLKKPPLSPEEKKQSALLWLETMEKSEQ